MTLIYLLLPGKAESRKFSVISHSESHPMSTRTKSADIGSKPSDTFPKKAVRTGFKTFDMGIIETLVVMESVYKVDVRKAPSLLAFIANKSFGQEWKVGDESTDDVRDDIADDGRRKKCKKVVDDST